MSLVSTLIKISILGVFENLKHLEAQNLNLHMDKIGWSRVALFLDRT